MIINFHRNIDDRWLCWSIFVIHKTEQPHSVDMKIDTGKTKPYKLFVYLERVFIHWILIRDILNKYDFISGHFQIIQKNVNAQSFR